MSASVLRDGLPRLGFVFLALLALAVLSRLLPHPPNFTALDAIAIYAGVRLADTRAGFLMLFLAMLIADAFIGFHSLLPLVYGCLAFTFLLGRLARGRGVIAIGAAGFTGATVFFALTNLAVWWGSGMYTQDGAGLATCFTAALPFYQWTLLGLVCYGSLLWVVDEAARRVSPRLAFQS